MSTLRLTRNNKQDEVGVLDYYVIVNDLKKSRDQQPKIVSYATIAECRTHLDTFTQDLHYSVVSFPRRNRVVVVELNRAFFIGHREGRTVVATGVRQLGQLKEMIVFN